MKYNENPPSDPKLQQVLDETLFLYLENLFSIERNYEILYNDVPDWEADDAYQAICECYDNIGQIKLT